MPATAERTNTVTIADAGPCQKQVTIQIPAEVVSEKLRDSLDALSVEAALPGFRKGRVPRALLEKKFGPTVRAEAKNQIVATAYSEAIEQHKLQVVGDPTNSNIGEIEIAEGKPLVVRFDVEVLPVFDLPALDGVKVKKPIIEVTDAMVDDELDKAKINEGRLESRELPEAGDYLTGHAVMKGDADGQTYYDIDGAVVQVPPGDKAGKGMVLGVMVDDFARQLGMPKIGESATIRVKAPANHEVEKIRDKAVTVTFKVSRIDRIIPASTPELLAIAGAESEEQIKDNIRSRLAQRVLIEQLAAMRQQIAKHLIDTIKLDVPPRMSSQQATRLLERRRMELMYRGVDPQKIEEKLAELRAVSAEAGARELKLFFILNRAAETLDVKVQEAEINGRIVQMARERGVRPEQLRNELIQGNRIGMIYQQIREHKTLDAILSKATVAELPLEEYNKQMSEA